MGEPTLDWAREKSSWPNGEHSRWVRASGITWHVQRAGAGPGLLLVHGTGSSTHSWRGLFPALARRFDVLAMDLPGHAFTQSVTGERSSLSGMGGAVSDLIRAENFHPSVAVGHSAGAAILCRMAVDGDFEPRMLIGLNAALVPFTGLAASLFAPVAKLMSGLPWVPRLIAGSVLDGKGFARLLANTGSELDQEGQDIYSKLARDPKHVAAALSMMAHWRLDALHRSLAVIERVLLLVTSARDCMVPPEQGRALKRMYPKIRLIELPDLGHLAHEETPDRIINLLLNLFVEL